MRKLILGNWKMHGSLEHLDAFQKTLAHLQTTGPAPSAQLGLAVPSPYLLAAGALLRPLDIWVGGQACAHEAEGAHTGDVSAAMLADVGASFVIVGHSERRSRHHEDNQDIAAQVQQAQAAGLLAVVCVGEDLDQAAETFVAAQLQASLPQPFDASRLAIAYEPVWAIGTGQQPTLRHVERICGALRQVLQPQLLEGAVESVPILYGGSVTSATAGLFLASSVIGGVLVGKASLNPEEFWHISQSVPAGPI
jgi:triosephosphate isomerase